MATYLVLVRHGQAEDLVTDDASRRLTEAGTRALVATMPRLREMLPRNCELMHWSSPLVRAAQTAEIVSWCLGDIPVAYKTALGNGDYAMLNFELDAVVGTNLRAGDPDLAIIAVGHEPMMSELAEHYCGAELPFGKGAVACIRFATESNRIVNPDEKPGRLMWFVQGAEAKRWQTLIDIEEILQAQYGEVRDRVADFRRNPADEEAVHQFRVSIRTLRSLVRFCQPLQDRKQNRAMQVNLRTIVRQLSRLRELDVLGEMVREAEEEQAPEGESLAGPIARARMEECLSVLDALDSKRDQKAFAQLDEAFANIKWRKSVAREGLAKADVQDRFHEVSDAYRAHMAELDPADWEQTHSVRKEAKQVRYDAAKFKKLMGGEAQGVVSEMKSVQEYLGDICDARVNQELLAGFAADYGIPEDLAARALAMAEAEVAREAELLANM